MLLPVNPVEAVIGGFLDKVIPAARERGIGVIGMKVLGDGQYLDRCRGLSVENLIRFARSQDVDLVIGGSLTPGEVQSHLLFGKEQAPMDDDEQAHMIETVHLSAERLAYYRGLSERSSEGAGASLGDDY
ncbi:MAG: hypothetical protein WCF90_05025 [Methanomicrobiales archaeon]